VKDSRKYGAAHSVLFVTLSLLFSALLHVVGIVWLAQMSFQLGTVRSLIPAEVTRAFSLHEIRKILVKPAVTRGEGKGKGGRRGDSTEGYTRKTNPSLVTPGDTVDGSLVGSDSAIMKHSRSKDQNKWQPRQEILAISEKLLGKDAIKGNRRLIPDVARVGGAPDIVFPVDYAKLRRETGNDATGGARDTVDIAAHDPLLPLSRGKSSPVDVPIHELSNPSAMIEGDERAERKIEALDDVLDATLTVYRPFLDSKNTYFRLEVQRISDELLPRLPKDIVFIQDSSASMAENRLHFCRDGIKESLGLLSPDDRFNIISFSDKPVSCFDGWVSPGKSSMEKGLRFASNLRSAGSTDILASLAALKGIDVEEGRPCIAFLVTDGLATTGVVESAAIIREFTKANANGVAVYTMGTMADANMYLLDLLSYCNGGSTHVVKGGRWSIAEDITSKVKALSRPVLSSLRLAFAGRGIEVFPGKIRHLYMDDPLVLYGRCPRGMERVTFQAIGSAADRRCDMIFDLSLSKDVKRGDKALKLSWAMQKAYHLMGELARTGDKDNLLELKALVRQYDLKLPYADRM
jgi:Mg-chelatase subunit ChlD